MTKTIALNRLQSPETKQSGELRLNEPPCSYLSNGIPVYIFTDSSQKAIRIDILIKAGSAYQNKLLVANSAVNMLSEGTKKYTSQNINGKIDYYGAFLDQQTTKDIAWITLYSLDKHLYRLLPVVESLIKEPLFKQKEFNIFNRRQKQEFLVNNEKNKKLAQRIFNEKIYGAKTAYGQTASETDFDVLQTADLIAFHKETYVPSNTKIIISGPVSDASFHIIEKHFGDNWSNHRQQFDFEQTSQIDTGLHTFHKKDSLQSAIMMGRHIMPRGHEDFFGFMLLNTLLGGYFGSRLMNNIREDKGYTYGIHSQIMPYNKASSLLISTQVGTEVTRNTLDEIKNEFVKLQNELVDKEELELVKNYLTGTYLRALDGVYNQAERFKSVLDSGLGMKYFANSLKGIGNVKAEKIQQLAQTYLNVDEMVTVVVGDASAIKASEKK